jgi:hypothetical protein
MNNNIRTRVRIPKQLQDSMLEAVLNEGYKMRGKSLWVGEAVDAFLNMKTYIDYIDIGSEADSGTLSITETFCLSEQIIDKLERSILEFRKYHPKIDGVKSIIIRSSILQRLLRSRKL